MAPVPHHSKWAWTAYSKTGTKYSHFSAAPLTHFTQLIGERAWVPRPHFSLLLWERVIDYLRVPLGDNFWHPRDLQSCAAVCRAWRPRARFNLWHTTMVRTEAQVRRLLDLIKEDPYIGQLVRELQLYPKCPGLELGCVSFHLPELARALPNLRLLCMKRVNWMGYPCAYSGVISKFKSLAVLHLWFARFRTVADFLRLVWSLRNLRHLVVHKEMFIEKSLSNADALRLSVLRKPRACCALLTLEVGDVVCEEHAAGLVLFPPQGVFGDSVTSLSLQPQGVRLSTILENVERYTRGFKHLQTLDLSVDFSAILASLRSDDPVEGRGFLPHLVSQLPSADIIHSISISVTGRAAGSRSRFLDALVGDEDEFGLLRERLPSLKALHFKLRDGGSDYLSWWTKGISGRLPSVADLLEVEIERVIESGWSEAPRSSPGLARLAKHVWSPTAAASPDNNNTAAQHKFSESDMPPHWHFYPLQV